MHVDYALVGQFVAELYAAGSLDVRFRLYDQYVLMLGFDGATYTFIPNIQLNTNFSTPPVFAYTAGYPLAFLDHYQAARLDQHDFTIRKVNEGHQLPLDWREHELQRQISPEETQVIVLAREDYDIRNALTIPTMTRREGIAGASVISSEYDDKFVLLKREKLGTLLLMTRAFHSCVFAEQQLSQQFLQPFLASLNQKEINILRHLADGKAFKQIDTASYRVAANILERLRGKFGGITRDRLMFLIGLLHLLDHS